jgi:hypothetical protein
MFVGIGVGVGRQRFGGGGVSFDPDYQAVLNYATSQSYTLPSASQQILQNQLVLDLKAGGIWSLMDTIYVYATDGDRDYAKLNWKSPSLFFCTEINSPTFTTNQGFIGNGTSSYLNTNWNAVTNGVNFQLNNASIVCYVFSASGSGPFTGVASGNNQGATNSTAATMRMNTTQSLNATVNMVGNGYTAVHKTSSLNLTFTKGTNQQDRTVTTDNSFNESHFILRRGAIYGAHTIFYAAYGANMKPYDSIYNTILTNYINSL